MKAHEKLEMLKAVLAVAAADGRISASERGVYEALAARVGIGRVSLDAMVMRMAGDPVARHDLFELAMSDPAQAFELLVATARIDGRISDEERELLAHVAAALGIEGERFKTVYQAGIARADAIRKRSRKRD